MRKANTEIQILVLIKVSRAFLYFLILYFIIVVAIACTFRMTPAFSTFLYWCTVYRKVAAAVSSDTRKQGGLGSEVAVTT
jgi:hypothetical protein